MTPRALLRLLCFILTLNLVESVKMEFRELLSELLNRAGP